jgi:Transposase
LDGPIVVLLRQDCADEADDRVVLGEDADDIGAALDFAIGALDWVGNRYERIGAEAPLQASSLRRMVRPSGTVAPGARRCGQADVLDDLRTRVSSWPPLRLARLRREPVSVGVVSPAAPASREVRRVIGIDIHRTFGEVVIWELGSLRSFGRIDMTRTALEGLGGKLLPTDEVVIEATGNCMAVSRVLSLFVRRVVIANPLQVKAIAHARVKTDKVDAGTLASLFAAGYLLEIWTPDAETERKRRLTARRDQLVCHRTRIKNEVHAILHAHLIPKCPHGELFNRLGRAWLARQELPKDERDAIDRHLRELDRLGEDLAVLDREIAEGARDDSSVKRLITITGVNLTVAAGIMCSS